MRAFLHWMVMGLILTAWTGTGWAGTQDDVTLETVVVTASREEEKASAVPAHVTVIDATDIENTNAQNIPELLASQGVHVSDVAGNRRNFWVDLRGFGESAPANTLVLVDGRRVNQPDLSAADWVLIPLDRIERVEIIRGGRGSVLYGDNAAGGVINIITKEGKKTGGRASAAYGSYDTYAASAAASAVGERWSLDVSGNYLDSEGYRENSGTEAKDAGITLKYDPVDTINLDISGGYHKDSTRLPGDLKESELAVMDRTASVTLDNFADTEDYYFKSGLNIDMLSNDSFRLEASARQRSVEFVYTYPTATYHYETEIDTIGLSPQLIFRGDFGEVKNRVSLGLDFELSEERISGGYDLDKDSTGYFVYDELQVAKGVTLSGGYRNDRAKYTSAAAGSSGYTILKEDLFNAGINVAFGKPGSHVYASYAKSYRLPLLDELFSFYSQSFRTDMREQSSEHLEAGVTLQATQRLRLNLDLFHVVTENEIYFDKIDYENRNMDGETKRVGLEAGLRWRGDHLGMGANYTWTRARIDEGQYRAKTIPDVPEHAGSADLSYAFDFGLRLGLNGQYVGERYFIADFDNSLEEQEAYFVLNGTIKYVWRMMTLSLDLNNILNEEYSAYGVNEIYFGGSEEKAFYPSPEFNWLASVKIDF